MTGTDAGKLLTKLDGRTFPTRRKDCAVLILAAGFEGRAERVLGLLGGQAPRRVVLVRYQPGVEENDRRFAKLFKAIGACPGSTTEVVSIDPRRPDDYLNDLSAKLALWRPDARGEIWVDISAFPMQGICATLAAVREGLPGLITQVLYTEAADYYPTKREVGSLDLSKPARDVSAISREMSALLAPKKFSGSSSETLTCLFILAGYEKARSFGVADELNPSKLVLIYGQPPSPELAWRLKWSQQLHSPLRDQGPTAQETVSTLNPLETLHVLNEYYSFLFADHNIAVSPICSKMQSVGCYLMWERYRDIRLVFPLPVAYLPERFSERYRDTFQFTLPTPAAMASIAPSPL